jgi:hypothetical protein
MGNQLARQLLVLRAGLEVSDRAFVVLLRMSMTALDRDRKDQPGRVYFAGWEVLAMTLGYDDPKGAAAEQAVARAIRELSSKGLVKRVDIKPRGRRRRTAAYELTFLDQT